MSRTKKLVFVCERKLLIAILMAIFLSIFVAANAPAEMYWKDYNDLELGGYMPDIDQNQDFANLLAIDEHFSVGLGSLSNYLWVPSGTCTVGGGLLAVDACAAYNATFYNPGHTLEFDATFNAYPYQHVGFGSSGSTPIFNSIPWILFSTGSTGTQLYARICPLVGCSVGSGDDAIALGAGYLGSKHRYRIDWKTDGIDCYIDGILKVSRTYTISTPQMRVGISDYLPGGGNLTADWISMDLQREYCAPVAEANSLWWLDKAHGLGIFEFPYEGLGYIGHDINGDGVADVLDLVQDLAIKMKTNVGHTGTLVADQQEGIETFLTEYNLHDKLYEHTVYDEDYATCPELFTYLEQEVERSQDVKLDLGFWHVDEAIPAGPNQWQVTWSRRGGHAVTVAGVDSVTSQFAISDPDNDAAEAGGLGVVRPVPHGYPHDPIIHNDEDFASHDIYTVGLSPSPGGKCGLLNYPFKWNFPTGEWEVRGPVIITWPEPLEYSMTFTEIEAAVIVSPPSCGDGRLDPGEECDDGNNVSGDGCSAICIIEFCGDNIVQPQLGEQCDDGNNVSGDGCSAICIIEFCGDNIVQPQLGEQCDDGNNVSGDGCNANCITEFCGDNIVQPQLGETCDPQGTPMPPNGNLCRLSCTYCGDGIVNNAEACDDGNGIPGDGCENNCTITPFCGDGLINAPGETCDPPQQPGPNPLQPGICRGTCTFCGDGIVNNAEACDDGNGVNNDGCKNNCTLPACGDGIIGPGETCDPPGGQWPPNGNPCSLTCTYCGDGIKNNAEACDDGNVNNNDGCKNNCQWNPDIGVNPTSWNFGSVTVGKSSTKTFNVSNTGLGDLHITTITITGTNASEFSKQNDNCSGKTIAPSGNCTVDVKFSPAAPLGAKSATLAIPSDDPDENPLNVSLSGTAVAPDVTCSFTPTGATNLSRGSNLTFLAAANNNTDDSQTFQFASKIILPNGNTYPSSGWLLGPITITLGPHASTSKNLTQFIPYNAPFGTYTYRGYVGKASPPLLYNQCEFNFSVHP